MYCGPLVVLTHPACLLAFLTGGALTLLPGRVIGSGDGLYVSSINLYESIGLNMDVVSKFRESRLEYDGVP